MAKSIIFVEKNPPLFHVIFQDDNGESILAKTMGEEEADERAEHFKSELSAGHLLTPDASANEL